MHIPFVDLTTQYEQIKNEIDRVVQTVFKHGQFIQGPEVTSFENEFATFVGSKHCISLNSGTDALILGLRALGFKPGDEIIIPVNTFIATALGASENGLKPVFVDTDPHDHGIDISDLKRKINPKTKAVICVHLYGQPDKIHEIQQVIQQKNHNIALIEDACQSHNAYYKEKMTGTYGIFGAFSFYPGKNLGAYGDGGAIVTNNDALAIKVKHLREYGQKKKYFHDEVGINTRLDTLQAAILRVKLHHLNSWTQKRQQVASWYQTSLEKLSSTTIPLSNLKDRMSVFHLYVIRHPHRDALMRFLTEKGVVTLIHYPLPLHLQKAYAYLGYKKNDFPQAERIANEILSLPMYPEMTKEMVEYIVDMIALFDTTYHPS